MADNINLICRTFVARIPILTVIYFAKNILFHLSHLPFVMINKWKGVDTDLLSSFLMNEMVQRFYSLFLQLQMFVSRQNLQHKWDQHCICFHLSNSYRYLLRTIHQSLWSSPPFKFQTICLLEVISALQIKKPF